MSTALQKIIWAGTEFEAHRKKFDQLASRVKNLPLVIPSLRFFDHPNDGLMEFAFLGRQFRLEHVAMLCSEELRIDSVFTLSVRQGQVSFVTLRRDRLEGEFLIASDGSARWHIGDAIGFGDTEYFLGLLLGPPASAVEGSEDSEEEPYEAMAPLPAVV